MSHQLNKIFQALDSNKQVQIEAIMQDAHQKVEQISHEMANHMDRVEKEYTESLTTQQIAYFRQQLKQRQKIWYKLYNEKRFTLVKDILNSVFQRINEFSQQPSYKETLQALIFENKTYLDTEYSIHGRPSDEKYLREINLPGDYELILDQKETGIMIKIPARELVIENSLESRLRQRESQLVVEIALILFESLEADPWEIPQAMAMLMRESVE